MQRIRAILFALPFAAACAAGPAHAASPFLKEEIAVAGDIVRIGDLVAEAGAFADIPVFRAPDLGHSGEVATARVLDTLRSHGLTGVDTRGVTHVTVTRLSRSLGAKQIEERVAAALAGQPGLGDAANFTITFDREPRPLHLAPDDGALRAVRVRYDPSSTRFDITFEAGGEKRRLRYTGTAFETIAVAVLVRPVARGDVIDGRDVAVERRPKPAVVAGALDRPEQLVGLAARRPLQAGQPVRPADLMKPELVRQNDLVLVVYETAGLSLSMRGKALDSGAEGDLVNVLNVHSKRTMQGRVTGPGRVSVAAVTPQVVSAEAATTGSVAAAAPRRPE